MYFCPICGGFLVTEQSQSINLSCPNCPYTYKLTSILKNTSCNKTKALAKIIGEDDLKYANKCQAKCPKCTNNEALFLEVQTRSADEPSTIFYQCTVCRFDWKE